MSLQSDLETERDRIVAAIAASSLKPNFSDNGFSVSYADYRASLFRDLEAVNKQIALAEGPIEYESQGL